MAEVRGPVVRFRQSLKRGDLAVSRAEVVVVALRDGRPVRLPADLRARFQAHTVPTVQPADVTRSVPP